MEIKWDKKDDNYEFTLILNEKEVSNAIKNFGGFKERSEKVYLTEKHLKRFETHLQGFIVYNVMHGSELQRLFNERLKKSPESKNVEVKEEPYTLLPFNQLKDEQKIVKRSKRRKDKYFKPKIK